MGIPFDGITQVDNALVLLEGPPFYTSRSRVSVNQRVDNLLITLVT